MQSLTLEAFISAPNWNPVTNFHTRGREIEAAVLGLRKVSRMRMDSEDGKSCRSSKSRVGSTGNVRKSHEASTLTVQLGSVVHPDLYATNRANNRESQGLESHG